MISLKELIKAFIICVLIGITLGYIFSLILDTKFFIILNLIIVMIYLICFIYFYNDNKKEK